MYANLAGLVVNPSHYLFLGKLFEDKNNYYPISRPFLSYDLALKLVKGAYSHNSSKIFFHLILFVYLSGFGLYAF